MIPYEAIMRRVVQFVQLARMATVADWRLGLQVGARGHRPSQVLPSPHFSHFCTFLLQWAF